MTQNLGTTTGQQMGQSAQTGGQQATQIGGQTGQQMGAHDGGRLPQQYRTALASVSQAVQVCGWCADQCIQEANPNMIECIRLCEDVVEIGEALLAVAPRSSRFTAEVAQTFQRAAQACAQECSRHQASHCQECATVLDEAVTACQQLGSMAGQGASGGTGQRLGQ